MKMLILFIKGIIIGIGKVIPGVSGSIISIILGIYKDGVNALKNPFDKNNFKFLLVSGFGILFSIIFGSKTILYLLDNYYFLIMLLFSSLILGTIPIIKKEVDFNIYNLSIIILISVIFIYLSFKNFNGSYIYTGSLKDFYFLILVGFIEMGTMIIPGISGTVILMMLGVYNLVTETMSRLFMFGYLKENIMILFPILIGMLIGFVSIISVVNFLLNKYKQVSFVIIFSFCISSFLILLIKTFKVTFSLYEFLIGIFIFIVGYLISKSLENLNNN